MKNLGSPIVVSGQQFVLERKMRQELDAGFGHQHLLLQLDALAPAFRASSGFACTARRHDRIVWASGCCSTAASASTSARCGCSRPGSTGLVVDLKTQRGRAFKHLDAPKRPHVVQVQAYTMLRDAAAGVLLYVDREGQNATRQFSCHVTMRRFGAQRA